VKPAAAAAVIAFIFCLAPLSGAQAVHDGPAAGRCLDCHRGLPFGPGRISFSNKTEATCRNCHNSYHGGVDSRRSHPVHVAPSMSIPEDMPLDREGRTTCVTCHTYHRGYKDENGKKLFFLRRSDIEILCSGCHKREELNVFR
jgi:predicted CXXCH cytochrome family protein